jgi:hypothetical protein
MGKKMGKGSLPREKANTFGNNRLNVLNLLSQKQWIDNCRVEVIAETGKTTIIYKINDR